MGLGVIFIIWLVLVGSAFNAIKKAEEKRSFPEHTDGMAAGMAIGFYTLLALVAAIVWIFI
jgi:hypothetical protein